MVLCALEHVLRAIKELCCPGRVTSQQRDCQVLDKTMRLNVGFVHNVEPMLVAELVPTWVVRVVSIPHRVEVPLLQQPQVPEHVLFRQRFPLGWVQLMHVSASHNHRLAIDAELTTRNVYVAETNARTLGLQHVP
jgi:hypothetical protein